VIAATRPFARLPLLQKARDELCSGYSPCFALLVRRLKKWDLSLFFCVIDLSRATLAFQNPNNARGTPETRVILGISKQRGVRFKQDKKGRVIV